MEKRDLLRAAEQTEVIALETAYDAAGDEVRLTLGLSHARIGDGFVGVLANDRAPGCWSRAVGLGVTEPLTNGLLDEVLDFAREAGARQLTVQLSEATTGSVSERDLVKRGLVPERSRVVLVAPTGRLVEAAADLPLEQVGPDLHRHFARVICAGYGLPEDPALPLWLDRVMARPDMTSYAAFDDWDVVGVASLFVDGGVASLRGAATLPVARGRGVYSSLVARRLRDAAALGVQWVVADVAAVIPRDTQAVSPGRRALVQLGFDVLYERRCWTWRP